MDTEKVFKIVVSEKANTRLENEILEYLAEYLPSKRLEEILSALFTRLQTLESNPYRGRIETRLLLSQRKFRFILFRNSKSLEFKIIYWVDKENRVVVITDFFPTRMNPEKIK